MTQDDVLRLAKEAGIYHAQDSEYHWDGITDVQIIERTPDSANDMEWRKHRIFEILERYTKLVQEHEREACAKVCDKWPDYDVQGLAEAIRARGENT